MRSKANKRSLLEQSLILRNQKLAIQCVNDYFTFFYIMWDTVNAEELKVNWHIPYIANELETLARSVINREKKLYDLILNVPPGSTKTSLVSIFLDIWIWLNDPTIVTITSTYSGGLSRDISLKSRRVIESDKFKEIFQPYFKQKFGKELVLVKDNENIWINNFNGSRIFTSTGGTVTGKHAHLIKRDDPQSPEQAISDAYRLKSNRYNDTTLSSRKIDKKNTPTISVMQRLHEDDTTGHDLKKAKNNIRHISLPAEQSESVNPPELKEKYIDGLLDPIRMDREVLDEALEDLGSYGYSGQFQQEPIIDELAILKREYWRFTYLNALNPIINWHMFIDGAYTEKKQNDPTGVIIAGIWQNKLIVRFAESKRLEIQDLIPYLVNLADLNNFRQESKVYIEPKASGQSIRQLINSGTNLNAVDITGPMVGMSKIERANRSVPRLESGRVVLVEALWNDSLIAQCAKFPKGKHDEYIDLISYALDILMPLKPKSKGKKVVSKSSLGLG